MIHQEDLPPMERIRNKDGSSVMVPTRDRKPLCGSTGAMVPNLYLYTRRADYGRIEQACPECMAKRA